MRIKMPLIPAITLLLLSVLPSQVSSRFIVSGPVLTVTLKDPDASTEPSKWLDLGSLHPNAYWSVQSKGAPLPAWFPSLKGIRGSLNYRYEDSPMLPSDVSADVRFAKERLGELQIQPSYNLKSKKATCEVQIIREERMNILTRLSSSGERLVEFVKGSILVELPFQSLSTIKITPAFDFVSNNPTCVMEGVTGSGRTKAILNLQWQDPTLTVVHALDERNTIAPQISLQTAKILYSWTVDLNGGSIETKVDPTSAVHVTWTDQTMSGRWVTDFSLPLKGTTVSALAANVRVRRQFTF